MHRRRPLCQFSSRSWSGWEKFFLVSLEFLVVISNHIPPWWVFCPVAVPEQCRPLQAVRFGSLGSKKPRKSTKNCSTTTGFRWTNWWNLPVRLAHMRCVGPFQTQKATHSSSVDPEITEETDWSVQGEPWNMQQIFFTFVWMKLLYELIVESTIVF